MSNTVKKFLFLAVAAVLVAAGYFVSIPGLSFEGTMSLFVMLAGVVLWVAGVFPIAITGLLLMLLLVLTNTAPANDVVTGFVNSTMIFILFVFTFGTVLKKTPYSQRLVAVVLRLSKGNSLAIALGFLLIACILSWFMSNLAVVAILLPVAVSILEALDQRQLESNIGKVMLIGLPIAAMVGGAGTPIGHPMNALCVNMLEQMTDSTVSFGTWCLVGVPLSLIIIVLAFLILEVFFKPEKISDEQYAALLKRFEDIPVATSKDKLALASLVVLIVMLVAGTWVPALSVLNVGIAGLVWFMFPKVEIITWEEFVDGIAWDCFLMFGSVCAVIGVLMKTGAAAWLANVLVAAVSGPGIIVMLALAAIACGIVTFFPVGPSLLPVVFGPFMGLIIAAGFSPACVPLLVAFTLGGGFILAINPPLMVSLGSGYWKSGELVIPGLLITLMFIIVISLGIPGIIGLVGA